MYDNKWNDIKEGERKNRVEEKSENKLPDSEGELQDSEEHSSCSFPIGCNLKHFELCLLSFEKDVSASSPASSGSTSTSTSTCGWSSKSRCW